MYAKYSSSWTISCVSERKSESDQSMKVVIKLCERLLFAEIPWLDIISALPKNEESDGWVWVCEFKR